MRSGIHFIPILTTIFSAWFAPQLLTRWRAHRPAPHLFWWGLGVALYGVGTFTESLTTIFGWHDRPRLPIWVPGQPAAEPKE